ncbi:hypothetical protein ACIODS_33160 [Micromonospora chalcea]|uniref:hypothetical protein n=1 Tax=Micromonospora chalcea TaxID=1874 RepID=UPI00378B37FB
MSPLVRRFRAVVAIWIFVGGGGFLLAGFLGLALLTRTGPFAAASAFSADAEFAPGTEIKVSDTGVRPGAGAEAFALTTAKGIQSDGFRLGAGLLLMLLAPVFAGFGCLALYFTRKWNREAALRGGSTSWPYR